MAVDLQVWTNGAKSRQKKTDMLVEFELLAVQKIEQLLTN